MLKKILSICFFLSANLCASNVISGGYGHSAALTSDGTVVVWGSNDFGQRDVPAGLTDVKQISIGGYQSLALKNDGTVVGWGRDEWGTVPDELQGVTKEIAAGGYHAIALKNDSTLLAWGGLVGGLNDNPTGKVARVFSGMHTMAAIMPDSTVQAWGLGGGDDYTGTVPADLREVVDIAVGRKFILAIKKDNTVVAWGEPASMTEVAGMPAGLKAKSVAAGDGWAVAVELDGTVVQWGNLPLDVLMPSNLSNIVEIAAGRYHVLAVDADGVLYAWGSNSSGQCDIPSGITVVQPVAIKKTVFIHSAGNYLNFSKQCAQRIFSVDGRLLPGSENVRGMVPSSIGAPMILIHASGAKKLVLTD